MRYYEAIRAKYPDMTVNLVDHHSKVGPHIGSADVLMTFAPLMADHVLKEGTNVKWVHALTTGTDGIDNQPSLRSEVLLTSTRGIHGPPMTEAALMSMLALARDFPSTVRNQDRHAWEKPMVHLLDGKTVGILGVGLIGKHMAQVFKAMGMKVVGVVRKMPADPAELQQCGVDRIITWDERLKVFPELDYVVLLIPSRPETRGLLNAEFFAAMKPSAYFLNYGRGDVVDDNALIAALRQNRIAGAALDVFHPEPLPEDHPYWSMPNVIVIPHLGGFSLEYADRALPIFYENLEHYRAGNYDKMINRVKH
jgi:D-2-hydroxyacid dehydrogenase (NADP+)